MDWKYLIYYMQVYTAVLDYYFNELIDIFELSTRYV